MLWVLVAVVVVLALIGLFVMLTYNGLIGKRNQVQNAWSQIDVQLKRRHDLIPNLVNAVKGYLVHERDVLDRVTTARSAAIAAGANVQQRAQAENELTGALRSLFAVAENYPQLRATENVMMLQEELSSTENRIAASRQFYNDEVQGYNTFRETFPRNVIAGSFSFQAASLFQMEDAAQRQVPQVAL